MSALDEMRVFVNVVEANTSTKAAERMGIAVSAVSRRLKDLEARLGATLMQRTTRRMHLTEDGKLFYERCKRLLDDLHEAEQQVSRSAQTLNGIIKISTPVSFGVTHLAPALADFMHQHEKVTIHLDMSDQRVDLIEEGVDLAIRIGQLEDSTLIARKLADIRHVVCCSPDFLKKHQPIKTLEHLADLPALCYANLANPTRWKCTSAEGIEQSVKVKPALLATNGEALREFAHKGLGIMCEPTFIVNESIDNGLLKPVLTEYQWYGMGLYAIYPHTRHLSLRVRTLIDFLVERFSGIPYWDNFMFNP
jgi:DNA-binding transcriptional LysR family regulator